MSFASEVKSELSRVEPEKTCCQLAEISGFLRVAGKAVLSGKGRFGVTAETNDPAVARHYIKLIKTYFGANTELEIEGIERFSQTKRIQLPIGPEEGGEAILRETGLLMVKQGKNYLSDGIYEDLVKTKCCKKSYLRGIFLGSGTISDPAKGYHWEVVCDTQKLAEDLKKLIGTFVDLSASVAKRRNKYVVYIKNSAYISDVLTIMGAHSQTLVFESKKVDHQIRAAATRITNCDNANTDRAIDAAQSQVEAILHLKKTGKFEELTPKVREIAELRLENPDASLTELGQMFDPPLKKSGVNSRLKRVMELARS